MNQARRIENPTRSRWYPNRSKPDFSYKKDVGWWVNFSIAKNRIFKPLKIFPLPEQQKTGSYAGFKELI
ncbi:hypothetical protein [Larkinella harenae]